MNSDLLRGKLAEKRITQDQISKMIGISPQSFSRKIRGVREFSISEAEKISETLGIEDQERVKIFLK